MNIVYIINFVHYFFILYVTHIKPLLNFCFFINSNASFLFNPEKIILFGLYARGNWEAESDIDVFIVYQTKKSLFCGNFGKETLHCKGI